MNLVHIVRNSTNHETYDEKVVARYDPHSNPEQGVNGPTALSKVGKYALKTWSSVRKPIFALLPVHFAFSSLIHHNTISS